MMLLLKYTLMYMMVLMLVSMALVRKSDDGVMPGGM